MGASSNTPNYMIDLFTFKEITSLFILRIIINVTMKIVVRIIITFLVYRLGILCGGILNQMI